MRNIPALPTLTYDVTPPEFGTFLLIHEVQCQKNGIHRYPRGKWPISNLLL